MKGFVSNKLNRTPPYNIGDIVKISNGEYMGLDLFMSMNLGSDQSKRTYEKATLGDKVARLSHRWGVERGELFYIEDVFVCPGALRASRDKPDEVDPWTLLLSPYSDRAGGRKYFLPSYFVEKVSDHKGE